MKEKDNKIRVLHIIDNLQFGGAQVVVKQIVENTNSNHFQHTIYALRTTVNDLTINGEIIKHGCFRYDLRKFLDLINICRKKSIDIVHAHLEKSILGALLLTWFYNVPIILHEHGPITRQGISHSFYRLLLRRLNRRCAAVISNSNAISDVIHKRTNIPNQKIIFIPNAVDLQRFQSDTEARARLRKQFCFTDTDIVIGFAGRFHEVKGIDCLVAAMRTLVQKDPRFKLALIGDGPLKESLQRQVQSMRLHNHIVFLGYQQDVSGCMNLFDIGCLPSRHEAFGIAAIEMMSMKIPLICSSIEGLGEITEHNKTALHLPTVTPEEIAQCILKLSRDPHLKETLRSNGFEASRSFGIERFIDRIEQVYRQTIRPN